MARYQKFFQFKITQEMYDWLEKKAIKEDRSMGSIGRKIIMKEMEMDEENKG